MTESKEIKESVLKYLRYTPVGFARWLKLRLTGREIAVTGKCYQCGRCCRHLNLSYGDRWIRSKKDFQRLLKNYPGYSRFHITGRADAGLLVFECDCIGKDGLCTDHENKPDICRDYPEEGLVFTGGELLEHCGYSFIETPSFSRMLEREKRAVDEEAG